MKLYPLGNSDAWQSEENVKDLDKIVKARWKNITKAIKALGIKISRRPRARKTQA
jgi:hypothetical protein